MKQVNFRTIELARQARGYTQKDLADSVPIAQPHFSRLEKGDGVFSDEMIGKIANVLNYPVEFFFQDIPKIPLSNIYFRKRATLPQKVLDKIFADVKIILKSIDNLLEDVELKEFAKYSFDISEGWTPQAAAIRARELLKIGFGPIKNLVNIIENEGIIVYFYDCKEEKFDGLTAYTDFGHPVIFINKNLPNDRIRFTISHELGHLLLHLTNDVEPWRDVEDEANNFASEFLMPERDCLRDLYGISYNKLGLLKSYWGVSKAFIIRRAKTLGVINESTYKYLIIELGRKGERKNEKGYVDVDAPNILSDSINLMKNELGYSVEDMCVIVRLYKEDYTRYFEPVQMGGKIKSFKMTA